MVKLLIDTCVWLDIAKDHKQQAILSVLDDLIELNNLELILPKIIITEFERNKARIVEENKKSLVGVINRVKEMVNKFGDDTEREKVLSHLSDIQHKSPILGEYAAQGSINWIETLFTTTKPIKITNGVKIKAAERAIAKIAPFHRAKNNMADAVIIESYFSAAQSDNDKKNRYLFVTHNTEDFSHPSGNKKLPHPDFDSYFNASKSKYYINLSEALKSVWPDLISDMLVEREEFDRDPRTLSQILESEDELVAKIWYNRHQVRVGKIQDGSIQIIEDKDFDPKTSQNTITKSVWKGAQKSALKVEMRFKGEQLVWDDFEWGMLNGKLSALRWVLGEEWNELYT